MRISNCCKVEVANKYLCPKCGKICKSTEVLTTEFLKPVEMYLEPVKMPGGLVVGVQKFRESAAIEPDSVQKPCKTEKTIQPTQKEQVVLESPQIEPETVFRASNFYSLSSYMGCEGVLTIYPDANIHFSYQDGSVVVLTSYVLGYVKDGKVDFKPILHVKGELSPLDQAMYNVFKRDWNREFAFMDKSDRELYWILSEKNFFRSMSFDMDDLISQGKALDASLGKKIELNVDAIPHHDVLHVVEEYENGFYALHDQERKVEEDAELYLIDQERHN